MFYKVVIGCSTSCLYIGGGNLHLHFFSTVAFIGIHGTFIRGSSVSGTSQLFLLLYLSFFQILLKDIPIQFIQIRQIQLPQKT